MSMLKYVKDQSSIGIFNVFGDAIDDKNRTAEEHDDYLLGLRLTGADPKLIAQIRPWAARTMKFSEFVQTRLMDGRFAKDRGIGLAHEIQAALRDMKRTGWLTLAAPHWETLRDACDKPEGVNYHPFIAQSLHPFSQAIGKAIDELPPEVVRAGPVRTEPNGSEPLPLPPGALA